MDATAQEQLDRMWSANLDIARQLAGLVLDNGADVLRKQMDVTLALVGAAQAGPTDRLAVDDKRNRQAA